MNEQKKLPSLETWPKYYASQLILNREPDARVVLTTGWTKKEEIWNKLSPDSRKKVLALGQLYSEEGINFIIRNLFLNPKANFLILSGRDLSGSIKELKGFLSGEKKEFIHEEIPEERLREFVDYFSKNHAIIEPSQLNDFLSKLDLSKLKEKWTDEPLDFLDHKATEATTFPSEKIGFRIEGEKVADVWLKLLDRILKFGHEKMSQYGEKQRELVDMVTVISNDDPDNPHLPSCLYFKKEDLLNYYPQMMTDNVFEGVEYTYGSRLRNYGGINQIKEMIEELKKENYSRRAVAFTWNVEKDCKNEKSPCLDLVQALVQDDILYFTAYFRSNDMYRAWPFNAYGLLKIQKEIAEALNLRIGKMAIVSCSAHIYERDFLEAEKMVEKNKPSLECEIDPRGNFVMEVLEEEIIVKHVDSEGMFLQEFRGKTARELRDKISRFVSDTTHGIYLGSELYRAEQALKNKTEFIQDSES
jgi:thymidylate synthase